MEKRTTEARVYTIYALSAYKRLCLGSYSEGSSHVTSSEEEACS
jgi:hypothetical protein